MTSTATPDLMDLVAEVAARLDVTPEAVLEAAERHVGSYRVGAAKRGRDSRWPYVPMLKVYDEATGREVTFQIGGLAYRTRPEALDAATAYRARWRRATVVKFGDRRHRALRALHGLPTDFVA